MKYEVTIETTVRSRIVIESKIRLDDLPPGAARGLFANELESAAVNYNAQNNVAAIDWRNGNFGENACFQGEADEEEDADFNLEEWNGENEKEDEDGEDDENG